MTTQDTFDKAVSLDDGFGDDVCPNCGQNIKGFTDSEYYLYHYRKDHRPSYSQTQRRLRERTPAVLRYPFINRPYPGVCAWTSDDLSIRAAVRRIINEGVTL